MIRLRVRDQPRPRRPFPGAGAGRTCCLLRVVGSSRYIMRCRYRGPRGRERACWYLAYQEYVGWANGRPKYREIWLGPAPPGALGDGEALFRCAVARLAARTRAGVPRPMTQLEIHLGPRRRRPR